jgi:hypothetical protein
VATEALRNEEWANILLKESGTIFLRGGARHDEYQRECKPAQHVRIVSWGDDAPFALLSSMRYSHPRADA